MVMIFLLVVLISNGKTFNTSVGDVDTGLVYTQMTKNEAEAFFNGPVVDYVGLQVHQNSDISLMLATMYR